MRKYGDILIVAVDAGYGNMKTATTSFPTGLIAYDERPYFTENLLCYNGKYYIVGAGHKEFTDKKINDEDYYILTLAAIARELASNNLTKGRVVIASGLPLMWVVKQRDEYKQYLLKNRTVKFSYRGTEYNLEIVDAMIFPQGYAAIADKLSDFTDVNIVADIGNGTVNLLRVVERRADVTSMATEACGVKDCKISMRTALANEHSGAKVDDSVIERIIRTGTANIDEEYLKTLTEAAKHYTEGLLRRFREYGYDEKTMRLYVIGGGSCLIRNFTERNNLVVVNSDIHANAKGYEELAMAKLRRAGGKL